MGQNLSEKRICKPSNPEVALLVAGLLDTLKEMWQKNRYKMFTVALLVMAVSKGHTKTDRVSKLEKGAVFGNKNMRK